MTLCDVHIASMGTLFHLPSQTTPASHTRASQCLLMLGMFLKNSCSNACLTVLRAPFGREVGAFLATFFADCVALLAACLVADLALPASLFAAPFITVREPLLACVRNNSMMEHRLDLAETCCGPQKCVSVQKITLDQTCMRLHL